MMPIEELRTYFDWKEIMLTDRGLQRPDGRQLYQYRLREDEFNDLEAFLRSKIKSFLFDHHLSYLATRPGFADLFVLYGAEWWRRRYDGSGFAWEPILQDLGADSSDWGANQRSDCVREGLSGWSLNLIQTGGHRFLGAVAVQGGLPMRLLAEARGRVGQVIGRVLRHAKTHSVAYQDLLSWVESLENMLPKSYRQPAIFTLLADVAWTVLDLKQKAGLDSGANAVKTLDLKIPGWRDKFPLPMEDQAARGLIEQLVREAASLKVDRQSLVLPLERSLIHREAGDWIIRSGLDLPETLDAEKIAKLFSMDPETMPRIGEITLIVGTTERTTSIRKMAGQNSYRVVRSPWGFSGERALGEHLLRLTANDGREWSSPVSKGHALDDELPLIFSADDENLGLLRQGGGSVAAIYAYVVLPMSWSLVPNDEGEVEQIGLIVEPTKRVFRAKGNVVAVDINGMSYRIQTGHAGATDDTFEWRGNRSWLGFLSPTMAFTGKPTLFKLDEDGHGRSVNGDLGISVIGSPGSNVALGPVYLRYPATGEIKCRTRMALLPPEAGLSLTPTDATSGSIRFKGWRLTTARVSTPGIEDNCRSHEGDLILDLAVRPGSRSPDRIEIEALWGHTTTPVRISLPFPAKGVRGFDRSGLELRSGDKLALRQLIGARLVVLGGYLSPRNYLKLRTNVSGANRKHRLTTTQGALGLEIRISDYLADIQHLLSIDSTTDATVRMSLEIGGNEEFCLDVSGYAGLVERIEDDLVLTASGQHETLPDQDSDFQVNALRLENPGDEPVVLHINDAVNEGQRSWRFADGTREPGCWLIYPGKDAIFPFRPTLWHVPGDPGTSNAFVDAIGIADQDERNEALDKLIKAMASDFLHPNWIDVEQTADQIGHLPLSTLDLWRRFARIPDGMASLAFRFGTLKIDFLYRFAQELPFSWETIPYTVWKHSISRLVEQCESGYGLENGRVIVTTHLRSRISELSAEFGGLAYILGIAGAEFILDGEAQAQGLRFFGLQAVEKLFVGANCDMMDLRRVHAEDQWPEEFGPLLKAARKDQDIASFLYGERFGHPDCVINLPLALAAETARNRTEKWFSNPENIHILRTCRSFDTDWFDEAFNQTIARCLAEGLLDN